MQNEELPQYLKNQKTSDNDVFSGNSQYAQDKAIEGIKSGNGPNITSKNEETKQEKDRKKGKKNAKEDKILLTYLSIQIQNIEDDIKRLEEDIRRNREALERGRERAEQINKNIKLNEETLKAIDEFQKQGLSRKQILHNAYKDTVFSMEEGNIWESLQHNILKDDQGRMVYQDQLGRIYHLTIDPETGKPLKDPETHLPVRTYYDDPDVVTNLLHQAFAEHPPKLFGNETPSGKDILNNFFDPENQWVYFEGNDPDGNPFMLPPGPDSGYTASVEKMEGAHKICSDEYECLKVEKVQLDKKIDTINKQILVADKQIKQKEKEIKLLQKSEKNGFLSEEEQEELQRLREEAQETKQQQEELKQEYTELEELRHHTASSLQELEENPESNHSLAKLNNDSLRSQYADENENLPIFDKLQKLKEAPIAKKDFSIAAGKSMTTTYNYLGTSGNVHYNTGIERAPEYGVISLNNTSSNTQMCKDFSENLQDVSTDKDTPISSADTDIKNAQEGTEITGFSQRI